MNGQSTTVHVHLKGNEEIVEKKKIYSQVAKHKHAKIYYITRSVKHYSTGCFQETIERILIQGQSYIWFRMTCYAVQVKSDHH